MYHNISGSMFFSKSTDLLTSQKGLKIDISFMATSILVPVIKDLKKPQIFSIFVVWSVFHHVSMKIGNNGASNGE